MLTCKASQAGEQRAQQLRGGLAQWKALLATKISDLDDLHSSLTSLLEPS